MDEMYPHHTVGQQEYHGRFQPIAEKSSKLPILTQVNVLSFLDSSKRNMYITGG